MKLILLLIVFFQGCTVIDTNNLFVDPNYPITLDEKGQLKEVCFPTNYFFYVCAVKTDKQ